MSFAHEALRYVVMLTIPPALVFPVVYHFRMKWWRNSGGRLIMNLSIAIAIFYTVSGIVLVVGPRDPTWLPTLMCLQLLGSVWMMGALYYQFYLFTKMLHGNGANTRVVDEVSERRGA